MFRYDDVFTHKEFYTTWLPCSDLVRLGCAEWSRWENNEEKQRVLLVSCLDFESVYMGSNSSSVTKQLCEHGAKLYSTSVNGDIDTIKTSLFEFG